MRCCSPVLSPNSSFCWYFQRARQSWGSFKDGAHLPFAKFLLMQEGLQVHEKQFYIQQRFESLISEYNFVLRQVKTWLYGKISQGYISILGEGKLPPACLLQNNPPKFTKYGNFCNVYILQCSMYCSIQYCTVHTTECTDLIFHEQL